ncbi:MFS transporter [Paenibacillus beijingensis]|uniref:Major facilitator transporter n=1 Tax=Paenibacillus beijingensis TaxID=1126833 RepID=A0A0D5NHA2_9BACL|nr:MFS transporter [Paenibacillus beijingensis]AJY74631.1 major facilitator transporter [Paenibacillus beijingensis]
MSTTAIKPIPRRKLLFVAGLGWLFDAMDVGIIAFIGAALMKDWNLLPHQVGWIGSVNSIGMMVGALLAGILADRVGRKPILIATILLFSVASGLSALTTTFAAFLVLRFIIGVGLGGELPVSSTLVSESVPEKHSGRTIVLLDTFWVAGWVISALISFFVIPRFGWQWALVICALPAFYTVFLRKGIPDSPSFRQPKKQKPSIAQNIKTLWSPKYRKTTLMLWLMSFCVFCAYYGMFLWLPSVMVLKGFALIKSFGYVLVMTLAQLPGLLTAAWLIDKIGRKFVLVTFLAGAAVCGYLFGNADSLAMLMLFGILLSFFNVGAIGTIWAYTPEQYEPEVRSTGTGMASALGRIGGILGPLVLGYLVKAGVSFDVIFATFCIIIAIGALSVLVLGKETRPDPSAADEFEASEQHA